MPKEPTKAPVPPEKNKNDDHPSWTPKDDLKQIVTREWNGNTANPAGMGKMHGIKPTSCLNMIP